MKKEKITSNITQNKNGMELSMVKQIRDFVIYKKEREMKLKLMLNFFFKKNETNDELKINKIK